jgi:hypothetical protein
MLFEFLVELLFFILQVFGEVILQYAFEIIVRLFSFLFSLIGLQLKAGHPVITTIIFVGLGLLAGKISLLIFPTLFIKPVWARILNLLLTPFFVATLTIYLGLWPKKLDEQKFPIETFACSFLFALSMTAMRFAFGV